jgi:hypothetical protein
VLHLLAHALAHGQADVAEVAAAIRVDLNSLSSGAMATGRVVNSSAYRIGGVRLRADAVDATGRPLELGARRHPGWRTGCLRVTVPPSAAHWSVSVVSFDLISFESS